jgi:hypothetical protein
MFALIAFALPLQDGNSANVFDDLRRGGPWQARCAAF